MQADLIERSGKAMLSTFIRLWKKENIEEEIKTANISLIVPISFTTLRSKLVNGTRVNMEKAIQYQIEWFPNAVVAFSSCSYLFDGSEIVENSFRAEMCQKAGIEPIIAKSMINTVDEAMSIRDALNIRRIYPKCILLVTGELHSRSVYYIWRKLFPDAYILITCIPHKLEIQPDHLVLSQRKTWTWIRDNIARQIALRILPLSWIRKIRHKPVMT